MSTLGSIPDFVETEIGIYPSDWEIAKIENLAKKMQSGGTPRRSISEYWNGEIPFVLIRDITSVKLFLDSTEEKITKKGLLNSSAWLVPPNTILYSLYATIGATAINTIPVATNQAILAIIPNSRLNLIYGAFALKYHSKRLKTLNIQSTQKNVNKGLVKSFKIPLPPLSEQRNIAFILSTVQEAIEKTEKVIEATKELKKSLMEHLFTYGPVPITEREKVKLKETEIGEIPEEWEVVQLDEILEFTQYGLSDRAHEQGTYPILRMNNLYNGIVDISDLKYLELGDEIYSKFKVNKGDILFNRTNSIELVGKTSIFDIDFGCVFASYLIRLVTDRKRINPEFLNYYLNKDSTQLRLKSLASRGVSQSNISASKLKKFCTMLPELKIQEKIISVLSLIDEKTLRDTQKKIAIEKLFKSFLEKLMTGKIRVKDLNLNNLQSMEVES